MAESSRPSHIPGALQKHRSRRYPDQVYYLYVPRGYDGSSTWRLLVTIHGQDRGAVDRLEHFVACAERHGYILLGPLFPPSSRFQMLGIGGERADQRLLDLVDEVADDLAVPIDRFDLFGYSGGGQFAHRFLYVRPTRLRSVIVGAPGTVTLPSERDRWPVGVRGLARVAGARFDLEEVRRPRVLLIVGTEDVIPDGLNQSPWAMRTGATRLGRARTLHAAWLVAGIAHEYVEVPVAGHGLDDQIIERTCRFLAAGL
jgi:pimeloyl-ACP methyl ester carboxylesterase